MNLKKILSIISFAALTIVPAIAGAHEFSLKDDIVLVGPVPGDRTHKWKWAVTNTELDPYEYAVEYCKTYCTDGDQIHAVINFNNNTTTCLNYTEANGGSVDVTVREYVKYEWSDAELTFTGEYIKSRVYDISTGFIYDYDTGETITG